MEKMKFVAIIAFHSPSCEHETAGTAQQIRLRLEQPHILVVVAVVFSKHVYSNCSGECVTPIHLHEIYRSSLNFHLRLDPNLSYVEKITNTCILVHTPSHNIKVQWYRLNSIWQNKVIPYLCASIFFYD